MDRPGKGYYQGHPHDIRAALAFAAARERRLANSVA